MKLRLILVSLIAFFVIQTTSAQTVDEIISNYFENTGGIDNWKALKGIKMTASVNQGGMDIPITMIQLADGRRYMKFELQGKEITQGVFDGDVVWGTNFMTMEPEKSDSETTENTKRESGDFPDPFLNMKENGYSAELLGKETIEGTECFKVKLTKKPQLVDGQEVDNINYYYFDSENFVPIVMEAEIKSGQMKGKTRLTTFSDYQEVDGLYFPFAIGDGIKDMGTQVINITAIELNPEVDDSIFKFPESAETTTSDN
ncbi:MAG: outer membrane lipoprotein-sorting protein [Cyclobacteriaceae bacterium]|nr:outer membrane lipoprotein-sorting protein [Cyclobacteriaceae bacterium]